MANKKRKAIVTKRSNSNTHDDDISNVKTEPCNNLLDLPIDIIFNIISRLHVKLIVACVSLSKAFKNIISDPLFSNIYHTNNKSNSIYAIFVHYKKHGGSLDLVEFDIGEFSKQKVNYRTRKDVICNTKRLPGGTSDERRLFSDFSYINGLFCVVVVELGFYNLFVINPLLGEFIRLPEPVFLGKGSTFSFGIGYCQLSNRYKVLRINAEYVEANWKVDLVLGNWKADAEIFTLGVDRSWRSLGNVSGPYTRHWGCSKPCSTMVSLHSVLHWIVKPVHSHGILDNRYISAFNMTEEKGSALELPPEAIADYSSVKLAVIVDKLCLWRQHHFELWVMDEYGVDGSWTKQFVLDKSKLPTNIEDSIVAPLIVLPEGVIVLSDCHKLVFYDMKNEKCLRVIHQSKHVYYPIPFDPNFVPLRNLIQGPGLVIDVQSCSPVSEVPRAFPGDQLQVTNSSKGHGPGPG